MQNGTNALRLATSLAALTLLFTPLSPSRAAAQGPVDEGGHVGYELALSGAVAAERGAVIHLSGVAYEVEGLATLRPTAGLEITSTLYGYQQDGSQQSIVTARTRSAEGGHVDIEVAVPEETLSGPYLSIHVARAGQPGRTFTYTLSQLARLTASLLTDRNRYEPGETVHLFGLVRGARDLAPVARQPVRVTLYDPSGATMVERAMETTSGGAVTTSFELPEGAVTGNYRVELAVDSSMSPVSRSIEVFQRTVERVMATVTIEQEVVGPSEHLTGRVRVTTPSGAPIPNAQVELHIGSGSGEVTMLTTGRDGVALIDTSAPSFLSGEVQPQTAWARITHPAYGTITASASYTLSRSRWIVSALPEGGGLVPEIDSQLFLTVSDPRGRPITAGTTVDVRGLGVSGGHVTATTDAHGLAMITVRLPRGAAARLSGGQCSGSQASTTLDVEIGTRPAVSTTVCAAVALDAQLMLRARAPMTTPGARVELDVLRRSSASGRAVLIEALYGGRSVASAWAAGSASSASITLPAGLQGVIQLRARPLANADARAPNDQPGATLYGVGASTALLVRPADAFSLSVAPDAPLHGVREHAMVQLSANLPAGTARTQAWATLLARDEAQQGGEDDYAVEWINGQLREAVRAGATGQHERFVRAALAAGLTPDGRETTAPPLVPQPWDDGSRYYGPGEGVLRDPIAAREELLRRGLGQYMAALEQIVAGLGSDQEMRDQVTHRSGQRVDFAPNVIDWMVQQGNFSAEQAITLGGTPLTVAMLTQADPSFSFDSAARRVARSRLVRLLVALSSLTNADDAAALRASAGAPPDRWLSLLVQLGMLEPDALVDPWGRAFVLHRVTGRHPAVVVSERALDWELSSPGPDGVPGNADDVRDPFQRVVPRGTPYAVVSGEDELLAQLSTIAPGEQVLAAMATAYQRLGLAAQEEMRGGVVTATTSESTIAPAAPVMAEEALAQGYGMGMGGLGMARASRGDAEYAYDDASGAMPTTAAPAPPPMEAQMPADRDADGIADSVDTMSMAGALIREDFPATLFFLGEVALDGSGHATVDVPLADAITTYRLEAISWTASGWITSGRGDVRVDQEATIDAPVPESATLGDHVRIPVRVQNRTDAVLPVRFAIEVEGAIGVDVGASGVLEVPAHEAAEQVVELDLRGAGEGALVIRCAHTDGHALDAVRRPMHVYEDARLVRQHREQLVEDGATVAIDLPAEALPRGPAELTLSVAGAIFGDPATLAGADPYWGGWAYAMDGEPLPDALAASVASQVHWDERWGGTPEQYFASRDPLQLALAVSALWSDDQLDARSCEGALRAIAVAFPDDATATSSAPYDPYGRPYRSFSPSMTLLALAPAVRSTSRTEARAALDGLVTSLRRLASREGAEATEAPEAWARVAAALLLTRRSSDDDARAVEMLRRTERSVVAVGNVAWLEPDSEDGSMEPRVIPTSLLALARVGQGDRQGALTLLRSLAEVARGAQRWSTQGRALASAAAAVLATGVSSGPLVVTFDGAPLEVHSEGGSVVASIDGAQRAGQHQLHFALPDGSLALLRLDVRYGMPWTVAPAREAPVEIAWSGETGARDTRAGLSVTITNHGTRVLGRPVVDIEMPAGTELDEPTRDALANLLTEPVQIEGTTMRLVLRPIAPAGYVRIPIRARWSLGGSLRGLGVSVVDESGPSSDGLRPTAILASRAVEITDRGPEAQVEHAESSPPPRPPPPPPMPRPLAEAVR
jgi:hypothetical protein